MLRVSKKVFSAAHGNILALDERRRCKVGGFEIFQDPLTHELFVAHEFSDLESRFQRRGHGLLHQIPYKFFVLRREGLIGDQNKIRAPRAAVQYDLVYDCLFKIFARTQRV